ncbi:phosphate:Na+ symporter [Natranaerovirga pectinivora]|uniref:Phosphate:Na+ symporter n=1 Tax=Natranaerovirga pectinivora TaxID=682400 RepID=A0A4V2V0H8_9FIRM|nr:Na/Pi cotransporter family protein [Natranaerovirga pectinivora]TCT16187.1 phosphate:Na+ symporter [Natranaerovirga pectinivora]
MELIITFIGGFAIFLYGMNQMGKGLQKAAGNKMKQLLAVLTNNRFLGVIVGALVTAIVQSSSATTVMIVGFVNAGLLNLTQAVGVIMGANIGTTITSWVVAMGEWSKYLKPDNMAPVAIAIGAYLMFFTKDKKKKQIGEIFVGFGMLFIGLGFMSDAVKPYRTSPVFKEAFKAFGENPFLGILVGAVVTFLVQSSSASVGILQTIAAATFLPFNAAVYIILGQNIGTCMTALLSSIGANKTAKRAAYIHLLFNIIGTIIFTVGIIIFFTYINPEMGYTETTMTSISIFHTIFNVGSTLLLFPFASYLVHLSGKIVRGQDKPDASNQDTVLRHLDERILETPSFAVENAIKEVVYMGRLAIENTKIATEALLERDVEKYQKAKENEKHINKIERLITDYLVKISNTSINEHQKQIVNNLFNSINDIERVGDHAENIAELAEYHMANDLYLSDDALQELTQMIQKTIETIELAIDARENEDIEAIRKVIQNEEIVDTLEEELRERHIKRLSQNLCTATTGVVFLDTISNLERISDHALNIAYYVKDEIL